MISPVPLPISIGARSRRVVTIAKSWKTVEEKAEGLREAAQSLDRTHDVAELDINALDKVRCSLSDDDLVQIVGGLAFGSSSKDDCEGRLIGRETLV